MFFAAKSLAFVVAFVFFGKASYSTLNFLGASWFEGPQV